MIRPTPTFSNVRLTCRGRWLFCWGRTCRCSCLASNRATSAQTECNWIYLGSAAAFSQSSGSSCLFGT